jgi:ABC-type bacteriocin/lantibiotic exporter with double-glycine peptidase domain
MGAETPKRRSTRRVRTPTRLQMEATECGAAALAIVLEHHGTFVPLAKLREQCGISRDGSKASNLLKAARQYGLEARGFRKEPRELRELAMPVVVHWNFNHFMVVEGFGRNKVYVNDPAVGPGVIRDDEFDRSFTGVTLTFAPTSAFRPRGRRPRVLPALLRRLRGARMSALFVVLAGLALVLPATMPPLLSMVFVDEVLIGGKRYWLSALLGGMALTAVLRLCLAALQRTYLVKLFMKLGVTMSSRFMWHALRLPLGFYFARMPGDLAGRVRANDAVASMLSGQLASVALDLMLIASYGAVLACLDPWLALIGLLTVVAHVCLLRGTARRRADLGRRAGQAGGELAGVATGGLQMIETLKAAGAESQFFAQWAGHQAKLVLVQQALARREQWTLMATAALSHVNTLLVLSVGALRVIDGHLSIGALVAAQGLMVSFVVPVERIAHVGSVIQLLRGDVERLDDVLEHEVDGAFARPVADHAASPEGLRRLTGELELRKVTFGYLPFAPPLVCDLDLRIAPGERVSLVGGTGSGKSTIAKLVCGLYRPWSGDVLFDREPRESLPSKGACATTSPSGTTRFRRLTSSRRPRTHAFTKTLRSSRAATAHG